MNVTAIIPARYASLRLPGKPLIELAGKPMILHVCDAVSRSGKVEKLLVATDDERIADVVEAHGYQAVLTSPDLPSGTDRIAAAARMLGITTPILNVQGDEPMLDPRIIDALIEAYEKTGVDCVTPVSRIRCMHTLLDPAAPKVVMRDDNTALYFSRTPIPHVRDYSIDMWLDNGPFFRHIGLYLYSPEALQRFVEAPSSELEQMEQLEQLRMLGLGMTIGCVEVEYDGEAVDLPRDVKKVDELLRKKITQD